MNIRRNAQRSLTVLLAIALLLLPLPSAVAETFSAFVKSSSMKVYSNAKKTSKLATLSQYTVVSVLEYSGSTARISWSGKTGYASVSDMERVSAVAKVATIKSATRVYKSASTSSESVQVSAGMQVNVIHVENGWAIVERNGVGGYIAYDQLNMGSSPTTSATVTSSSMKVYASASTSSAKLGTLKKGAQVNVVSVSGSWAYVERNGSYGYCKVSSLKLSQAVPASTPTPTPAPTSAPISVTTMKVTSSSVTIYTKASTSSSKLGTLKKGKLINVISTSGKWAYVEFNGKNGYCKLSSLGKYDPLEGYKKETFTATVVRNGAKIYETASSSASSKALNLGADVAVSAYNDTWAYVQIDGVKGFVQIAQLSRAQFATLSKGSTGSNVSVLEKALLIMGYLDGTPDTTFDSATMAAVQRFQQALSRTASGEADASLQRVLYSGNGPVSSLLSSSYAKGSSGSDVSRIQTRLLSLGYLSKSGSVDGSYGTTTYNAVGMFQAANGLTASGSADSATIKKMYSTAAVALPSGKSPADLNVNIVQPSSGDQVNNSATISSTLASKTTSYSSGMSTAEKLEYVIYSAQCQLGKPYVFGATGTSSYDCSGLTVYSYKQIGVTLPRTAYEQGYSNSYTKISSISELKRGDLVFFDTISDSDLCDHTGIYLGAGWFIQASSGQHKVVVSTLASGYYNRVFSWGRRVL